MEIENYNPSKNPDDWDLDYLFEKFKENPHNEKVLRQLNMALSAHYAFHYYQKHGKLPDGINPPKNKLNTN